jgi:hypothetical protein
MPMPAWGSDDDDDDDELMMLLLTSVPAANELEQAWLLLAAGPAQCTIHTTKEDLK